MPSVLCIVSKLAREFRSTQSQPSHYCCPIAPIPAEVIAFETAAQPSERLGVIHERIPVKTPTMNAYVEAFHSILEDECYGRNDFADFLEAYKTISEYTTYYNHRRRHGSIGNMAPAVFHAAFLSKNVKAKPISALSPILGGQGASSMWTEHFTTERTSLQA
jgi:putative transposase